MKKLLLPLAVSAGVVAMPAFAEPTIYGKVNVSFSMVSEGDTDTMEVDSNASRVGLKAKWKQKTV